MMTEITNEFALAIHEASVAEFGGSQGVRDAVSLDAALARPFATFGGEFFIQSPLNALRPLQKVSL